MLVALLIAGGFSNPAWGQDHYCGAYSAYAVLDHYGRKVPFDDLLKPKYVSGFMGSTASEVVEALVDHGVAAAHYSGLGVFDLRLSNGPVILHVRGNQGTRRYEHWFVYLGETEGQAVVLDPSRGRSTMPYSRLLALWDGVGIASAASSAELTVWRSIGIGKRWAILVVLGCLLVPVLSVLDRRQLWSSKPGTWGHAFVRAALLVAFCTATAIGLDLLNPGGFLRSPQARGSIASVHGSAELPEIDLKQAIALHGDSQSPTAWIDARFQRDYEYGHIPGALNLPIDATFAEEDALIEKLAPGSKIVVYCQSEGCAFADAVSQRLRGHGFSDIQLYRPGYREWEKAGAVINKAQGTAQAGVATPSTQNGGTN